MELAALETRRPSGRPSARTATLTLVVLLVVTFFLSARQGTTQALELGETCRAFAAYVGLGSPIAKQALFELHLHRALVAAGTGAALALSGALMQGVFRNDLASPAILGVSAGASLGASTAILALGGYGPLIGLGERLGSAPLLVSGSAFLGALGAIAIVTVLASRHGRISVPTLLLLGIALNATASGLSMAIHSFALKDSEVSRALLAWAFGTFSDRMPYHAGLILVAVLVAAAVIPFVHRELDLFATGEEDAEALGVDTTRTKLVALLAVAAASSVAVAVAGQIAFVGLIVPHLLRLSIGREHRRLLPLSLLGGALMLCGSDWLQRTLLDVELRPGALMALAGGPFFLFLLIKNQRTIRGW